MNILITGANGFLGRELTYRFEHDGYSVLSTNRQTLNMLNEEQVRSFLEQNDIKHVIHTAVKGGKRTHQETPKDLSDNITMFHNLMSNKDKFQLMFHFCSGAAFDREQGINNEKEETVFDRNPMDYYGLSKNILARECRKYSNVINLRLFGCFGHLEDSDRLIKGSIERALKGKQIEIYQDKLMDFFYVGDLYKVILHYIKNYKKNLATDVNMCYDYTNKISLLTIADIISDLTDAKIKVVTPGWGNSYTGSGKKLAKMGIELEGLHNSIHEVYKELVKHNG
tara:strand:+ start:92 stop:937 length:846 start_codon:yes stop_codon:yes gene_type:complete